MVGLKKCGTNMIIRNFFFDLNKKWLEQYGFYNSLIDYHSNPNLIDKNKYFYDRIKYNFKDISKVAIVSSSVPIVLSYLLSQTSDVTLISNHPAFIKTQDFYTKNFNTTIIHLFIKFKLRNFIRYTYFCQYILFNNFYIIN